MDQQTKKEYINSLKLYYGSVNSWGEWSSLKNKGYNAVSGDFSCSKEKITSLKGCPEYIGGDFYCHGNLLTSLECCPKYIGGIFCCSDNNINNFTIDEFPETLNGTFFCRMSNKKRTRLSGKNGEDVIAILKEDKECRNLMCAISKESANTNKEKSFKL